VVQVNLDRLFIQGKQRASDFFAILRVERDDIARCELDIRREILARHAMDPLRVMQAEGLFRVKREALGVAGPQAIQCEFQSAHQGTVTHGEGQWFVIECGRQCQVQGNGAANVDGILHGGRIRISQKHQRVCR